VPYYLWVNLALPPSKYPCKVSRFYGMRLLTMDSTAETPYSSMRERVSRLGGKLEVESAPDEGVRIRIYGVMAGLRETV
jgi:hypothetical protein